MALQNEISLVKTIQENYSELVNNLDDMYQLNPETGIKMLSIISLALHKKVTNNIMRNEVEKDWQMGLLTIVQYQAKIKQYS